MMIRPFAKTAKSSMNTSKKCLKKSLKISIMSRWKVPGALHSPKGIRLNANVPHSVVKVVLSWSPFRIKTWLYPENPYKKL